VTLKQEIEEQGNKIRELKAKKVSKQELQPEVDKLLALKKKLSEGAPN